MSMKEKLYQIKLAYKFVEFYKKDIEWCNKQIEKSIAYRDSLSTECDQYIVKINNFLAAVEQLPEAWQTIILRIYIEGATIENIASRNNCTVDDIINIHDLALQKLETLI
ncbi:MAG: hypothetical protein J6A61_08805 [Clostridia bacterium]|nr:hypothetical protein [Clostridia bacterium]